MCTEEQMSNLVRNHVSQYPRSACPSLPAKPIQRRIEDVGLNAWLIFVQEGNAEHRVSPSYLERDHSEH